MEMTPDLFNSIINTAQDCVFWKDKDRRFVDITEVIRRKNKVSQLVLPDVLVVMSFY